MLNSIYGTLGADGVNRRYLTFSVKDQFFLTNKTEFALFIAVLENSVLPMG